MANLIDVESPGYPLGVRAAESLPELRDYLIQCRACPRLVWSRENVPARGFPGQRGWDKPVPGFGDPEASIAIVGLAPSADGSNRTGRVFTGDPSGDFLYRALYDAGFASQPTAVSTDDGLTLNDIYITASVKCVPPANKPTTGERDECNTFLVHELKLLEPSLRIVIALGGFGWHAALQALAANGWTIPRPKPKFGHGVAVTLFRERDIRSGSGSNDDDAARVPAEETLSLMGCFHTSPQNTNTGKLTHDSLVNLLLGVRDLAHGKPRT
ncbi:MAG: uracil-DNA glycosylase [Promicromonosporaceae bacterium]|nr:uracil-DNA glycosylase [Promicromonosporaceae bacterium]